MGSFRKVPKILLPNARVSGHWYILGVVDFSSGVTMGVLYAHMADNPSPGK